MKLSVQWISLFVFKNNGVYEIAAIWFVAKKEGFRKEELGMFADLLHRYLDYNFSGKYKVSLRYCISLDVVSGMCVDYLQLEKGKVKKILNSTVSEIKEIMAS